MMHRLLTGKYGRFEDKQHVIYRAGDPDRDKVDLSPAEVKALGKRVERIHATAPAHAEMPAAPKVKALGLDDMHWSQAAEAVRELKTVEAVQAAAAEERAGKDRKGVLDAAEARLAELEADR